ncbi:hypothetical protein MKJ01_13750 [Chryseobacterium sp. SSA4.19]|uniref:hypothetical protein n=1 Tax=Chryseobacterium sp. SSA4.19 TaxID=2919915 RepID=UPI001F4E062D|nr:hypothetical protein [Chryseobacterium sp. SSA4.19]MCJ8154831.1 hypothetical protein [Chryseobacterium sp. SSA4.19]
MDTGKITVRHASGTYTIQADPEAFDKARKKITAIIKGKNKYFRHRPDPDTLQVFTAEMLRQSVITFERQKAGAGLISQGII